MSDVTRSRLARMLRGEIPEEERQGLEARFLEDDALFQELAREEEELLEAWEDGELDARTSEAVDSLLRTSTRVQTLVDMTRSFEETDADPSPAADPRPRSLQRVLAKRSLPWIAWGLVAILALALATVLFLQYRIVRLLDEQVDGMRTGPGAVQGLDGNPRPPVAPEASPVLALDASSTGRQLSARFDQASGLSLEIRLDRSLLPATYSLVLERISDGRTAHRTDLSLERTLFAGQPLQVTLPAAALEPGSYRLSLHEEPSGEIAAWTLQLAAR